MSNLASSLNYTSNQVMSSINFIVESISPSLDGVRRTGGYNVIYLSDKKILTEIKSVPEQLAHIQKFLGLNVLALASILQVSRPTIYEWLDSKESTIRKKNQERLYSIYKISKKWARKNLGLINSYLHKPIGSAQSSLFSLLKSNELNVSEIDQCLVEIEKFIIKKRKKDKAHNDLLLNHGFEPVSQEHIDDNLDDLFFRD